MGEISDLDFHFSDQIKVENDFFKADNSQFNRVEVWEEVRDDLFNLAQYCCSEAKSLVDDMKVKCESN